jgi:hypothetical protein
MVDHRAGNAARSEDAGHLFIRLLRVRRMVQNAPGIDDVKRVIWKWQSFSVRHLKCVLVCIDALKLQSLLSWENALNGYVNPCGVLCVPAPLQKIASGAYPDLKHSLAARFIEAGKRQDVWL